MLQCTGLCAILMCYERNNIDYDKVKTDFETGLAMKRSEEKCQLSLLVVFTFEVMLSAEQLSFLL